MAVTNKNIGVVIKLLRKGIERFEDPSVTMVGRKYRDPYLVLISCILSLRTKDETTIPASMRLFNLAKDPRAMLTLSAERIEKAIYPVGFFRVKTRNILSISQSIVHDFGGKVPDDLDKLLTLKGVGRKTANLVLTEGFNKLGICVDTHVHRISNRMGYVKTKTPNETENILRKQLAEQYWIEYNALLVVWGQNICRPISPFCSKCLIEKYCKKEGVINSR